MPENKMYWVYVDDLREGPCFWQEPACPPEELKYANIIIIRTFDEALDFIEKNYENIERISLDHDLGEESLQKTGYELACRVEKLAHMKGFAPKVMMSHSANPVGWNKIMKTFGAIRRSLEY